MPVNEDEMEWQEVDRGDARFRRKQLGAAESGDRLGASLYELTPGGAGFPYHHHTANEEALYVLAGTGTLRLDDEEHTLAPGDYVALPAAASGAHRVRNDGEGVLRFLMVSTMDEPEVLVYPDSGKVGALAGAPPGGDSGARTVEEYHRRENAVDYWDGEGGGE